MKSDLLVILAKLLVFYLWLILVYSLQMCWVLKNCSILMFEKFWKRVGVTPTSYVLQCGRVPFASDVAYGNTAEGRLRRKQTQVNKVWSEACKMHSHMVKVSNPPLEDVLICFLLKLSIAFYTLKRWTDVILRLQVLFIFLLGQSHF